MSLTNFMLGFDRQSRLGKARPLIHQAAKKHHKNLPRNLGLLSWPTWQGQSGIAKIGGVSATRRVLLSMLGLPADGDGVAQNEADHFEKPGLLAMV
jgi:hypothetical protein